MSSPIELPTAPLHLLCLPWLAQAGVEVAVLRLDLIDPLISGNKWFKLEHHVRAALAGGYAGLISLGGAHSNHLHALAAAGQRLGLQTVGLVRGHAQRTPTTDDLQAWGMQLHWLGYGGYRERHQPHFWASWQQRYPQLLAVPEGGGGALGAAGCAPLLAQVQTQLGKLGWADFDGWWLAAGTGTTAAGLALAEGGARPVFAAMAVPPGHGVAEQIAALNARNVQLLDASRGGFARIDPQLLAFMAACERHSGVPLEPVYTGKALMALQQHVSASGLPPRSRWVFVHTGGLQGDRSRPR
ncbi:1-aminocyclopropane-1-carboxylate deaminase/D-cysteine desulfhydrase [Pseudomonas sp. nanlin1]|uniref:1-aminocyclopropane-1-carboxylate deaminase/D-cysteine desulfhydrase n=1 Tax=Pseudomonas sp. nanlin1 TaxID=3040605 RepID=UPI00388FA1D1